MQCIIERRISGESSFPYNASPVVYTPPSPANVAEILAEAGEKPQLARNLSAIQRKGYTSDEELEELDSPLTSVLDESPTSPSVVSNGNGKHKGQTDKNGGNTRYDLLREVWLS